jgi:hypothetical protein
MLCVQRLTQRLGPAANAVSGAAPWRPAPAIVLAAGKKAPYNLSTMIDPLDAGVLRLGGVRVRELRHTGLAAMRTGRQFGRCGYCDISMRTKPSCAGTRCARAGASSITSNCPPDRNNTNPPLVANLKGRGAG